MSKAIERLTELIERAQNIDLSKEEKENENALFFLARINGRFVIVIEGSDVCVGSMLLSVAKSCPTTKRIIVVVAEELEQ